MRSTSPSFSRSSPVLVSPYIHIPDSVDTFNFDTYQIDECFVLKNIAGYLFKKTIKTINYEIDEIYLTNFIACLCDNYKKNPFHNFQHAVNVLQMTYLLLNKTGVINKLNPHIALACLISALSHDVDHPGNTNSFEINSMSEYAKIYNDISVLENHHCSLTFELMEQSKLIKHFRNDHYREIRKTIISCILGTDMSKHPDNLLNFGSINFDQEMFSIEHQIIIATGFVHFADLSSPIKNFDICFEWSKRISLEFYDQTLKEEALGLESLSFMKAHDKLTICLNEINFITNISLPAWELFVSKFKDLSFIINNLNNSLDKWREMEKKYLEENNINSLNY
jgi:high affinity cGMP-specific 3',5'-cyclic phosphodiesterase 9